MRDETRQLVIGAIDLHLHTSPDVTPRHLSDIEAARCAQQAGMRAIVLRHHLTGTADRAQIASEQTGFPVFGAILLDHYVGGLNLWAAQAAAGMGARIINMPTIHSANLLKHFPDVEKHFTGGSVKGIYLLREDGTLRDEVKAILRVVAEKQLVLDSGYVSAAECAALVREAVALGIDKIVISNPLSSLVGMSLEEVAGMLSHDGVFVEFSGLHLYPGLMPRALAPKFIAQAIRHLGVERVVLTTDAGHRAAPPPLEVLANFIEVLLQNGFTPGEIRTMFHHNPARLLRLEVRQ